MATTTELPALDPLDLLAIDALLDDEERAIPDTVRQFVRENVLPEIGDWFEQGILPRELMAELAKLGLYGMHLHGTAAGRERSRLRPDLPGARGGRCGRAERGLGAGLARHVRDLALGLRGAEGTLASADARRRDHRLLRVDGARCRIRSRLDADTRAATARTGS